MSDEFNQQYHTAHVQNQVWRARVYSPIACCMVNAYIFHTRVLREQYKFPKKNVFAWPSWQRFRCDVYGKASILAALRRDDTNTKHTRRIERKRERERQKRRYHLPKKRNNIKQNEDYLINKRSGFVCLRVYVCVCVRKKRRIKYDNVVYMLLWYKLCCKSIWIG